MKIFYAEVGVSAVLFYFAVAMIGHMMLLRLFLAQFLEYFMQAIRLEDGLDSMSSVSHEKERVVPLHMHAHGLKSNENSIVPLQESPTFLKASNFDGSRTPFSNRECTHLEPEPARGPQSESAPDTWFGYERTYRQLCRWLCESWCLRLIMFLTLILLFCRFAWYPV